MRTSLLISTYNWPSALELVLKSALAQTLPPSEILIADDGSTRETLNIINSFKNKSLTPIIHFWHKDDGFKKSEILNKSIAKSSSDYIIQVDGDCILHKNFVKDHVTNAQLGVYIYGSRVNIKKKKLSKIFNQQKIYFTPFSLGLKKRGRAVYAPILSKLYKPHNSVSRKYRGCNTSFFRDDFLKINGYNEDIKGWGKEDSELALRFHNIGLQAKRLKFGGIVFHIWHKVASKDSLSENIIIEKDTVIHNKKRCDNGVDKYLNEL